MVDGAAFARRPSPPCREVVGQGHWERQLASSLLYWEEWQRAAQSGYIAASLPPSRREEATAGNTAEWKVQKDCQECRGILQHHSEVEMRWNAALLVAKVFTAHTEEDAQVHLTSRHDQPHSHPPLRLFPARYFLPLQLDNLLHLSLTGCLSGSPLALHFAPLPVLHHLRPPWQ